MALVFMEVDDMAFSDKLVYQALGELGDDQGEIISVSLKVLSVQSGVSRNTAFRALKRLRDAGKVAAVRSPGLPSHYRIIHEHAT